MVVMVMMVVPAVRDHEHRSASVGVMMMVVVMVMMVELRQLHVAVRRLRRGLLIHRLQGGCGVWNRLQQIGVGVDLQRVGRGRRGLGGA